jgi:hypothetical protein
MAQKNWTLRLVQAAWVVEVAVIVAYTIIIIAALEPERVSLWLSALPQLILIIAGQGTAAAIGPLAADHIKSRGGGTQ